ncbi:hypothetical protein F5Y01DRAFT_315833 [Xylaria sp. FL0043]|nr:hypothetical protein F5Y01DRAFT_315833 [Xylaria sp. FL0043]
MSIYSQHPTSIDAPAPVAASALSSKTAVVVVDESEVSPDHYQHHNEQNAWAEWERRRHDHHSHQHNHHSHRNQPNHHQQTSSSSAYYHLFPASPSPRDRPLTASSYFPTAQYHHQRNHHHRPASEEEESTHRRLPRFSCGAASLLVRGSGSPSRMAHVKGTVCVVLAIALIFIVVLVLALVSNNKEHS